jgi:O-antigen/teichoic acid export membrane protein
VIIYSEQKSKDAPEFYAKLTTYFIFFGLFMSLGISALAQDALRIMATKPFWSAYTVVPLICLSYVVYGSRGLLSVGIGLKRKTKYFPPMYLGAAGVNIVLNFLFIPKYGMMGAAVATLLSYLSMLPIRYYVGRRLFRVDYEWMRIIKMIVVATLLYLISVLAFFQTIWLSILVRGLIAVSFPFVLFVIGFYQDAEKRKIWEIFSDLIGRLGRKKRYGS